METNEKFVCFVVIAFIIIINICNSMALSVALSHIADIKADIETIKKVELIQFNKE